MILYILSKISVGTLEKTHCAGRLNEFYFCTFVQMCLIIYSHLLLLGAGFYLNATNEKWKNWRMYDYVVKELPKVLSDHFEQLNTAHASIFGHSMGGHGALTVYLKNTDKYKVFIHMPFFLILDRPFKLTLMTHDILYRISP